MLQSEQPKSKIPEPAASITIPESPLTENLEAIHNTEHNPNNSISLPRPPNDSVPANRGRVAAHLPKPTIPMFGGDP